MEPDAYPRPQSDTGLGFCYFPDEDHYQLADLERWVPEVLAMGGSWLVLRTVRAAPVPEAFVRGLGAARIEPVIHLYAERNLRLELADLRKTAERYAAWGVHYLCVYDQPNLRVRWGPEWGRPQLVERFVDLLLPVLQTIQAVGLVPVLPPLAPGGNYWDLAFLASLLDSLARRAPDGFFKCLAVGMHNYADNRPLSWGAGGPERWTEVKPYEVPEGSEDQRGFRLFEWYDSLIRARLGQALPLVSLGDGARLGERATPESRPVGPMLHENRHLAIADLIAGGSIPNHVLNTAFWVLATGAGDPAAPHAWYDGAGRPRTPAVQALKTRGRRTRGVASSQPEPAAGSKELRPRRPEPRSAVVEARKNGSSAAAATPSYDKALRHYVLLPVFEWGPSDWHWQAAQRFVHATRAPCGFSPDEARLAERVTIIGNTQGVSPEVEDSLRRAGCIVTRVAGANGDETVQLLNAMAGQTQGES